MSPPVWAGSTFSVGDGGPGAGWGATMTRRTGAGRQLERLFGVGAVGGQSDAELLERFAAGDEESAGSAFEAIVERHGPMVLPGLPGGAA